MQCFDAITVALNSPIGLRDQRLRMDAAADRFFDQLVLARELLCLALHRIDLVGIETGATLNRN